MENAKALVVYYSLSGDTRKIAEKLASKLDCDIEEIVDKTKRSGFIGFIKSGYQAYRRKIVSIEKPAENPADYDIVILGTPVWAGTITPAVRTYITANADSIEKVAFFCSIAGNKDKKTFRVLEEITGQNPVAKLTVTDKDRSRGYNESVDDFVDKIRENLTR